MSEDTPLPSMRLPVKEPFIIELREEDGHRFIRLHVDRGMAEVFLPEEEE